MLTSKKYQRWKKVHDEKPASKGCSDRDKKKYKSTHYFESLRHQYVFWQTGPVVRCCTASHFTEGLEHVMHLSVFPYDKGDVKT
jgi:hypothetical protein